VTLPSDEGISSLAINGFAVSEAGSTHELGNPLSMKQEADYT
jgi:hypothetical protein